MHLKQGFLLKHFIYHLMENVWLLPQMPEMNKRKENQFLHTQVITQQRLRDYRRKKN